MEMDYGPIKYHTNDDDGDGDEWYEAVMGVMAISLCEANRIIVQRRACALSTRSGTEMAAHAKAIQTHKLRQSLLKQQKERKKERKKENIPQVLTIQSPYSTMKSIFSPF